MDRKGRPPLRLRPRLAGGSGTVPRRGQGLQAFPLPREHVRRSARVPLAEIGSFAESRGGKPRLMDPPETGVSGKDARAPGRPDSPEGGLQGPLQAGGSGSGPPWPGSPSCRGAGLGSAFSSRSSRAPQLRCSISKTRSKPLASPMIGIGHLGLGCRAWSRDRSPASGGPCGACGAGHLARRASRLDRSMGRMRSKSRKSRGTHLPADAGQVDAAPCGGLHGRGHPAVRRYASFPCRRSRPWKRSCSPVPG